MKKATLILTIYALLILLGGIAGYSAAGSIMSLAMGLIFGLLLLGCSFGLYKRKRRSSGSQ